MSSELSNQLDISKFHVNSQLTDGQIGSVTRYYTYVCRVVLLFHYQKQKINNPQDAQLSHHQTLSRLFRGWTVEKAFPSLHHCLFWGGIQINPLYCFLKPIQPSAPNTLGKIQNPKIAELPD